MTLPLVTLTSGKRVKLGRVKSSATYPMVRFDDYYDPSEATIPHPAAVDYAAAAAKSLDEVLGNDREGCCVIAGKLHQIGLWTANDSDSGGEVVATTKESLDQYHQICGPGDNGCDIRKTLNVFRDVGLVAGGRRFRIDGYAELNPADRRQMEAAIINFGGGTLGVNVAEQWLNVGNGGIWDVVPGRFKGGHDVPIVGYSSVGVKVSTWGEYRWITWRALADVRFTDEAYAELAPSWYGNDKLSPAGINVSGLMNALQVVKGGGTPPIDPSPVPTPPVPTPPVPTPPVPTPPVPGPESWTFGGWVRSKDSQYAPAFTFNGTISPAYALALDVLRGDQVNRGFDWAKFQEFIAFIMTIIIPLINKGFSWSEIEAHLAKLWESPPLRKD